MAGDCHFVVKSDARLLSADEFLAEIIIHFSLIGNIVTGLCNSHISFFEFLHFLPEICSIVSVSICGTVT